VVHKKTNFYAFYNLYKNMSLLNKLESPSTCTYMYAPRQISMYSGQHFMNRSF